MRELNLYTWVALALVIIGGLNWGLVGLFRFDLFTALFGMGLFSRLIFILVGVAAGYLCFILYTDYSKKSTPSL